MKSKDLFIDCPTGLAGDMLLAGLIDIGVPRNVITSPLSSLGLGEVYSLNIYEDKSFGIRGLKLSVEELELQKEHRKWIDIKELILKSDLRSSLKDKVFSVFKSIAEAEASVHGIEVEQVAFHEIGAIDSLVDVIGVCAAIDYLRPQNIFCSIPPTGSGNVQTAHGLLPVPVPAVLEIAKNHKIQLATSFSKTDGELTTPTGLALMAVLANTFEVPKYLSINSIGVGLGSRKIDRPNLLRVCLLDTFDNDNSNENFEELFWEPIFLQQSWIDDATPEDLSALINELRNEGAVEVISEVIQMKKGRTGTCIKALVRKKDLERLRLVWFTKSTTLGVRETREGRWVLPRKMGECTTSLGPVAVKQIRRPNGQLTFKPEHDDLIRLSQTTGKSFDQVRTEIFNSLDSFFSKEDWTT